MESYKASVRWLSKEYYGTLNPIFSRKFINSLNLPIELNGNHVETLQEPPSAVEFSRLVHISRPVIIKGSHIVKPTYRLHLCLVGFKTPASTLWSNDYLVQKMGSQKISIAITPNGSAFLREHPTR